MVTENFLERQTSVAFIVGWPVKHSRSPLIHQFWLKKMNIPGSYIVKSIEPQEFPHFIKKLKSDKSNYIGGNITLPYKEVAYKLVDYVTYEAEKVGAVNTLWIEDGKLNATNTDGYGFSVSLDESHPTWRKSYKAVVLGAGGASRSIVGVLYDNNFSEIHVVNRTFDRARKLANCFSGKRVYPHPLEALAEVMKGAELFVNTTSMGLDNNDSYEIDFSSLIPGAVVTDIVYSPLKTKILQKAENQGFSVIDGLGMLLHQARFGFKKWFGKWPKVDD